MSSQITLDQQWDKWFKSNDEKQAKWVVGYLLKKFSDIGIGQPILVEGVNSTITDAFKQLASNNPDKAQLLLLRMKQAWKTKQKRAKESTRKPYSFVMDKDIKKRLQSLAVEEKTSMNLFLEKLIRDSESLIKGIQKEQESKIADIMQKHKDRIILFKQHIERQKKLHKTEVEKRDKEIEMLYEKVKELILYNKTKSIITQEKELSNAMLTSVQEDQVLELVVAELDQFKNEIKQEVDKISSLAHLLQSGVVPH